MSDIKQSGLVKSFSLMELIIVIILLSFFSYFSIQYYQPNQLEIVTNRLVIYLKQLRLQSFIDDQYQSNEPLWHKRRWTIKFFRCRKSVGGIYYSIYSDTNKSGHPNRIESLKDPLTKKYIYSSNNCTVNNLNSPYVLLTKQFNITDVEVSCNQTNALGQLSFGSDGKVYSKLSSQENEFFEYEIKEPCFIKIVHKNGTFKHIVIENSTGYVYKKQKNL